VAHLSERLIGAPLRVGVTRAIEQGIPRRSRARPRS
jgi:hypothetical protein